MFLSVEDSPEGEFSPCQILGVVLFHHQIGMYTFFWGGVGDAFDKMLALSIPCVV